MRLKGATGATYAILNSIPAPTAQELAAVVGPGARYIAAVAPGEYADLLRAAGLSDDQLPKDDWSRGCVRAEIDAWVALAYGLDLPMFAHVLTAFPNLDMSQPMLPGEPKSTVTRDIAIQAFCEVTGCERPDMAKLMRQVGSGLPDPKPEYRDLDDRVRAHREVGALPYRPTPKGARAPTDASLIADVFAALSDDAQSGEEIAEALGEDVELVTKILKDLKKSGDVYVEGRGRNARYYLVGED